MQLEDILANVADQDKGQRLDLVDPFEGKPVGIALWIVGPDSETAHRSRIAFADELTEAADVDNRVSAADRAKAQLNSLARLIIRWEAKQDGEDVPFNTANLLRLLRVEWVHAQVDVFAADRRNFRPGA